MYERMTSRAPSAEGIVDACRAAVVCAGAAHAKHPERRA
ncbi:hypothetical protein C7S13_0060 [Burkholderia cepacia]|nr:hypothetical protein [Burkholderia cepacia]